MQPVVSRDVAADTPRRARRPKPRRRFPPEALTDPEVRTLLDACGACHPIGLSNRALIAILYRAGLRVSEALALQPKDVNLGAGGAGLRNLARVTTSLRTESAGPGH